MGGRERRTKEAEKRDEEQRAASEDLIGWVAEKEGVRVSVLRAGKDLPSKPC